MTSPTSSPETAPARPRLLAAYPARQCPYRTYNDVTRPAPEWEPDPALQDLFDMGNDFEASVREALAGHLGDRYVDLTGADLDRRSLIDATICALGAGVEVVAGGQLPDDLDGRRSGKPDLLIKVGERPDGRAGYRVGEIKSHKFLDSRAGDDLYAVLAPTSAAEPADMGLRAGREGDLLQVAHYQRLLEAAGYDQPGGRMAALVGTDTVEATTVGCLWVGLDRPRFRTRSNSAARGWADRSVMERYDHEFGFRIKVVDAALGDPPETLVRPIWQQECNRCPWFEQVCEPQLGDDPSYQDMNLDRVEWVALSDHGIDSLDSLADLHANGGVDSWEHLESYRRRALNRANWASRLRNAAHAADLHRRGARIERTTTGPIELRRADIEIDLDSEFTNGSGYPTRHVFLWGARLHDRTTGKVTVQSFVQWTTPAAGEANQATTALWAWLQDQAARASASGSSLAVYHYTSPEPNLLRGAAYAGWLDAPSVDEVIASYFEDLSKTVKGHFFGVYGLGLKQIAREAGFEWSDEDPGGLQCLDWYHQVLAAGPGSEELEQRIVVYNTDDLSATAAVREWLTAGAPIDDPTD